MATKKDYIQLARCIKALVSEVPEPESNAQFDMGKMYAVRFIAMDMTLRFKLDNPHFDTSKFYDACGL